jgi:hypothetical protein
MEARLPAAVRIRQTVRLPCVLLLFACACPGAEPAWDDVFDPFDPSFPTGGTRLQSKKAAFERVLARRGPASLIRHLRELEPALAAIDKRIDKDYELYYESGRRYWGWRNANPGAAAPPGINRDYIDKEIASKLSLSIKRRERDFHAYVERRAGELVASAEHERVLGVLAAGLKDRDPYQRLRCAELLARIPGETKALRQRAVVEKHPVVAGAVVAAAGLSPEELRRVLSSAAWPVRLGAIAALERSGDVGALVEFMGKEEGRLRDDFAHALRSVTGQALGSDPAAWAAWWEANRSGWTAPERSGAPAGDGEVDRDNPPGVDSDGPVACFGIASSSNRMLYCVDPSPRGAWGMVRDALRASISALPDGVQFGVVVCGLPKPWIWRKKLTAAADATRSSALEFLGKIEPPPIADVHTGIMAALDLADAGRNKPAAADTMYLCVLRAPGAQLIGTPPKFWIAPQITQEVVGRNRILGVRIHALGISSGREAFYLQTITSQFGGTFRSAR